jgi:hypothetical protein
MGQVDQDLKTLADNVMAFFSADVGDEAHAAGVVLVPWVIEPLCLRYAGTTIRSLHGNLLNENFPCEVQFWPERQRIHAISLEEIALSLINGLIGAGPAAMGLG